MKVIRYATRGALPAVVAMLAILPTAPADAAAKKLLLSAAGEPAATGSAGTVTVTIAECSIASSGTVTANDATKDVITGTTSSGAECPHAGEGISGLITETQLTKTGKGKLTGSITISLPGSCSYTFKNPKGTFEVPGFAVIEGEAKGKLVKGSSKSCAKTDPQTLFAVVAHEPSEEPFQAELV